MQKIGYFLTITFNSVLLSLVSADYDTSICNGTDTVVPPPLPELSLSYHGVIEWKLLHDNSTISVQEYKDDINKVSSLYINMNGENIQIILDESAIFQYLRITKDGCTVSDLNSEFVFAENKMWLTTYTKFYNLMKGAPVTFQGSTVVRSIDVQHWHTCLYLFQFDITVQIDMYFAAPGWAMAFAPPTVMVPVRIELRGTKYNQNTTERTPFHVIGDFISFTPKPDFDPLMVQPPPGVFCPGRFVGKLILQVPPSFSALIEKIDLDFKRISYQYLWFDATHKFIRYDTKEASGNDPDPSSVVSDFFTGVKYNIDRFIGICRPVTLQHGDDFVVNAFIQNSPAVEMINASEFFHIQRADIVYVGKRKARDIYCDVWIGVYFDYDINRNVTVEWYFTEVGWTEAVGLTVNPGSLIRMDIWNEGAQNPVVHNVLRLDPTRPPLSVFDLANCYPPKNKTHFVIKFEVVTGGQTLSGISYTFLKDTLQDNLAKQAFINAPRFADVVLRQTLSSISYTFLKDTLQDNLAKQAFINAPRFADVVLEYSNTKDFFFMGTLLDKAPFLNNKIFPPPPEQHYLDAAFSFLHGLIEGGWTLNVTSAIGQIVTLKGINVIKIPLSNLFTPSTTQRVQTMSFKGPTLPYTGKTAVPSPVTTTPEPTPPFIPIGGTTPQPSKSTTIKSLLTTTTPTKTIKTTQSPKITCPPDTAKTTQSSGSKTNQVQTNKPCVCPKLTCPKVTLPPTKPPVSCPPVKCPSVTTQVPQQTKPSTPVVPSPSFTSQSSTKHTQLQIGASRDTGGVSSGGAAGIAIAMIIVGVILGIAVTIVYQIKFGKHPGQFLINKYEDHEKY